MSTPIWTRVRVGVLEDREAGAERRAGQLDHLEGADDAAAVLGEDQCGGVGVALLRAGRAAPAAPARRAPARAWCGPPRRCPGTRTGRGSRGCRAPSRRPAPASYAARRSRSITSRAQPWNSATVAGSRTVRVSSRWCGMPRRAASRQLGGADVHAAVDLHRVGVDDLAVEPLGEVEREAGLARRGGPDDGHDRDRGRGGWTCG